MKTIIALVFIVLWVTASVANAESEMDLAKTVQNPLGVNPKARYFNYPFVNYTNFGYGAHANTQNILDLKPVTPFRFTHSLDIIVRSIIPVMHQPVAHGYTNGPGDVNVTPFLSPAKTNWFVWAIGPTFTLPTANPTNLGAGKWSMGPELVLIAMPGRWTFAILSNNIWSMAGQTNRPTVNELTFQYFIGYNFSHGWFVTTQPNNTANWMGKPGQKWTVPVGGGIGRMFKFYDQRMSLSAQGYSNVIAPPNGPKWALQISLDFLFPDQSTI